MAKVGRDVLRCSLCCPAALITPSNLPSCSAVPSLTASPPCSAVEEGCGTRRTSDVETSRRLGELVSREPGEYPCELTEPFVSV